MRGTENQRQQRFHWEAKGKAEGNVPEIVSHPPSCLRQAPRGARRLTHFSWTPSPMCAPIYLHTWGSKQWQQSRLSESPRSPIWGKYQKNKIKTSQISSGIWVCPQFSHRCSVFGQQGRCVGWELLPIVTYDHSGGFQRQSALHPLGTLGSLGGIPQLYQSLLWKANPVQALSDLEAHVRRVTFGMHV